MVVPGLLIAVSVAFDLVQKIDSTLGDAKLPWIA